MPILRCCPYALMPILKWCPYALMPILRHQGLETKVEMMSTATKNKEKEGGGALSTLWNRHKAMGERSKEESGGNSKVD
ncbi:hypothetical protein LguiA_012508 [Lonicera macranthoides]